MSSVSVVLGVDRSLPGLALGSLRLPGTRRGRTFEVFRSSPPGSFDASRHLDLPPHLRALSPLQSTHPEPRAESLRPPLLGFGFRPSIDMTTARPLPTGAHPRGRRPTFGSGIPAPESRSDLAVSHRLAGFLRAMTCGLVASRCRSWGSPRFGPHPTEARCLPPRDASTLRRGPPPSAVPGHPGPCPLAVPSRSACHLHEDNVAAAPASLTDRRERRLRGLAPTSGSYLDRRLAASTGPTLPWALSLHH